MRQQVQKLAFELQVRGLMNVQFAVKDNEVYLIEVNPRAARTVPFVSKATGVPLAKVAARVMAGKSLTEQGVTRNYPAVLLGERSGAAVQQIPRR